MPQDRPTTFYVEKLLTELVFIACLFGSLMGPSSPAVGQDFGKNPERVEFSLLTVGRGEAVYALYGHTILRVRDLDADVDIAYNWGIFDFHNKYFVWNFYQGRLRYQMAVSTTLETIEHYRVREKRPVIEDKLRLTTKQKSLLIERLLWNQRPENIFYDYEQFRDNCSTKPRDHLDFALSGRIKARYDSEKSVKTFRDSIREGARLVPWIYLGLDQFTNHLLDVSMTPWQSMFIPSDLRSYLLQMPAFDDQGQPVAAESLLYGAETLVDFKEPQAKSDPYLNMVLILLIPAVLLGIPVMVYSGLAHEIPLRMLWIFYGAYSGVMGLVLTLNYFVSGYPQLKNAVSFLIFAPTDLLLMGLGLGFMSWGRSLVVKIYGVTRIIMIFAVVYGWFSGLIQQNIVGSLATGGVLGIWVGFVSLWGGSRGVKA
jgi:hypothetical protein